MSVLKDKISRPYRLQRRAAKQAETHAALARAAFELHNSIGPSRTTVSAIAEKAGVQRLTVYRHFPDQDAIFTACTAYSFAEDPPPNPESWRAIAEPNARVRTALLQVYGYYRRKRQLLSNLYRDAEMPVVAAALGRRRQVLAKGVAVLAEGWLGGKTDRLVTAAIGHALDFTTWRSLADSQELSDEEVADVMLILLRSVRYGLSILDDLSLISQTKPRQAKRVARAKTR